MKPVIGITPNFTHETGLFSLHRDYTAAIESAGGTPVLLFPSAEPETGPDALPDFLDGILLSGGGDIDPLLFGEEPLRQNGEISPLRDSFELTLCRAALESGLPLFGICRGMQVMNIAAGGTIYQDIPAQTGSTLKHSQQAPRPHGTHSVLPLENSLLAALLGKKRVAVNSFHHQAVARLGEGFSAAAHSPDGIIEAVERENAPFVLGVQWHPEAMDAKEQALLFSAFVRAAGGKQHRRFI